METKLSPEQATADQIKDPRVFEDLVEAHRHELIVHCYRILGSPLDAEDAVQETMLRAYRGLKTFTRDISYRAWLYKIATNVCLDALAKRRRSLPQLSTPISDPHSPLPDPIADPIWVEPFPFGPDTAGGTLQNPTQRYEALETISLAFVAALQQLPARQRAILILRDVLDYRAREVARMLESSTSAVNSALHRARTTMKNNHHGRVHQVSATDETLLKRYIRAWELQDVEQLVALLREDAILSMPPWPVWYRGHSAIGDIFRVHVFGSGEDRLIATSANGRPAYAMYRQSQERDGFTALGIQVLTISESGRQISAVDIFLMPPLVPIFGMKSDLEQS